MPDVITAFDSIIKALRWVTLRDVIGADVSASRQALTLPLQTTTGMIAQLEQHSWLVCRRSGQKNQNASRAQMDGKIQKALSYNHVTKFCTQ